ncbi:protein LTV1 [Angomonas deanei]|uniref:Protein LTV1 homolog n=1 Tax=Angomonas deanei TaxID=59799 RepID=A0A7G2CHI1_9TRYP|nr:protein LTV1 [Angomonas deanei]CAD2218517.1 hypothetical protein, conserved [Angomonas deanei]|eukprot:EPY32397.1 protein LTV1 [Angomonas deanei]
MESEEEDNHNHNHNHIPPMVSKEDVLFDQLFGESEETEITDDFLKQLISGVGLQNNNNENNNNENEDEDDFYDEEEYENNDDGDFLGDTELWDLLTPEEREAIQNSSLRGTKRRHNSHNNNEFEKDYPSHDATDYGVLEKQFEECFKEFDYDETINSVENENDPRTQGPLPVSKYYAALEEYIVSRAGVNVHSLELNKNKGFYNQIKNLEYKEGLYFDYNNNNNNENTEEENGYYLTTVAPKKDENFAKEFYQETEKIKNFAKKRILMKEKIIEKLRAQGDKTEEEIDAVVEHFLRTYSFVNNNNENNNNNNNNENNEMRFNYYQYMQDMEERYRKNKNYLYEEEETEKDEILRKINQKIKKMEEPRMDCETAISYASTYYNQPNVLTAPPRKNKPHKNKKMQQHSEKDTHSDEEEEEGRYTQQVLVVQRPKEETKEERKQRQKAVKEFQRERRKQKSDLKNAYSAMEKEEVTRQRRAQNEKTDRSFFEKKNKIYLYFVLIFFFYVN